MLGDTETKAGRSGDPRSEPMKPLDLSANDERVLDVLRRAAQPLSAHAILAEARAPQLKAAMQVYRSLAKLERRGLVHRVEALSAYVACSGEEEGEEHRPGFSICRSCGTVAEFDDARVTRMAAEAAEPGFAVEEVSVEVFGRCAACQRDAPAHADG